MSAQWLLALSTSTPDCSVVLLRNDEVASRAGYVDAKRHAERLITTVDDVCREAGVAATDLAAVACDIGPGSFTGTRVGLATAKGIALAAGIPLVGVLGLEAMARAAFAQQPSAKRIASFVYAKRDEQFFAVHTPDEQLGQIECVANDGDLSALLEDASLLLCGRAVPASLLGDGQRHIRGPHCDVPSATWIGRIARTRLTQDLPNAATLEPCYVRHADAKLPARPPDYRIRPANADADR